MTVHTMSAGLAPSRWPVGWLRSLAARLVATALLASTPVAAIGQAPADETADAADTDLSFESDARVSTELERDAAASPPSEGADIDRCAVYQRRALANYGLGRYPAAIADLTEAARLAPLAPRATATPQCDPWRIRTVLADAYAATGDYLTEIAFLKRTLAELAPSQTRRRVIVQVMLTHSYLSLGMMQQASDALQRARELVPTLERSKNWPAIQDSIMATIYSAEARLQLMQGNYRAAEELARQDVDARGRVLVAIAARSGADAAVSARTVIARRHLGFARQRLIAALARQGKLGEAAYYARLTLNDTAQLSTFGTVETARALEQLGAIRLMQGRVLHSARLFDAALDAMQKAQVQPYSRNLADLRAWRGLVYDIQEQWTAAVEIFSVRNTDLRRNREQFVLRGSADIDWAIALQNTGQPASAEAMLRRLIESYSKRRFDDPLRMAYLRGYLGNALAAQDKRDEALEQYRLAMPALAGTSQPDADDTGTDGAGGFLRQYRLRVIVEGYLELLSKLQPPQAADEAFKAADLARNSTVQRALASSVARANLPDARLTALARREQDAANRADSLGRLLGRVSAAPKSQSDEAALVALEHDVREALAQRATLRSELVRSFPGYAELTEPKPASVAEVRRLLRPAEAVIAFYAGVRGTYVWTISHDRTEFRAVALPRPLLERDVDSLRQSVDLTDGKVKRFDAGSARRLYAALLAPDAPLWASAKTLTVVPDGALAQIPFGLLLTDEASPKAADDTLAYAGMPWLIKRIALAQFPSASALVALRSAPAAAGDRRAFIGFGDPVFGATAASAQAGTRGLSVRRLAEALPASDAALPDEAGARSLAPGTSASPAATQTNALFALIFARLPPLPDTSDELRSIAAATGAVPERDLFLRERATVGNIKANDLAPYRIVAFATHGLGAGEVDGLDEPALAMSNPALVRDAGPTGFLTLDEVLGLRLNADWVVLSACSTAGSDGIRGEALTGLGRAFFYAGARSLLVSNWAIETVSARLLTTALFRKQAAEPGIARAEALREAMLDVMQMPATPYGHPAFWGAFSLVGDGGQ